MEPSSPPRFGGGTEPFAPADPSSPKRPGSNRFGLYCHYSSAPASPNRAAAIYAHFRSLSGDDDLFSFVSRPSSTASMVPFHWEDKPGTPKSLSAPPDDPEPDFEFAGHFAKGAPPPEPTTAEELFDQGRIRPLKPPPRLYQLPADGQSGSSTSPRNRGARSPRRRSRVGGADFDPFVAAMVEATKDRPPSCRARKVSRSLSPFRFFQSGGGGSGFFESIPDSSPTPEFPPAAADNPASATKSVRRKWRLGDLLVFRSASEGRAIGIRSKDPVSLFSLSTVSPSPTRPPQAAQKAAGEEEAKKPARFGTSVDGGAAAEGKKKAVPAAAFRRSVLGWFRFSPRMHRLAKGFSA